MQVKLASIALLCCFRSVFKALAKSIVVEFSSMLCVAGHALPMLVACVAELQRGTVGRLTALFFGVVLCLGLSALICTKNVPEKWKPGSAFDILHSHAIMHVLVYLEYYFEWLFICHHMYPTTDAAGDQ